MGEINTLTALKGCGVKIKLILLQQQDIHAHQTQLKVHCFKRLVLVRKTQNEQQSNVFWLSE